MFTSINSGNLAARLTASPLNPAINVLLKFWLLLRTAINRRIDGFSIICDRPVDSSSSIVVTVDIKLVWNVRNYYGIALYVTDFYKLFILIVLFTKACQHFNPSVDVREIIFKFCFNLLNFIMKESQVKSFLPTVFQCLVPSLHLKAEKYANNYNKHFDQNLEPVLSPNSGYEFLYNQYTLPCVLCNLH